MFFASPDPAYPLPFKSDLFGRPKVADQSPGNIGEEDKDRKTLNNERDEIARDQYRDQDLGH